jgi:hypothetical protein
MIAPDTPPEATAMRMPRFQLALLMVAVAVFALDFWAIRSLSGMSTQTSELIGLGVLPMGNILAACLLLRRSRPRCHPFLSRFIPFGAAAMAAMVAWTCWAPDSLIRYLLLAIIPIGELLRPTLGPWRQALLLLLSSAILTLPQVGIAVVVGWAVRVGRPRLV